jgi:hypothetical protein
LRVLRSARYPQRRARPRRSEFRLQRPVPLQEQHRRWQERWPRLPLPMLQSAFGLPGRWPQNSRQTAPLLSPGRTNMLLPPRPHSLPRSSGCWRSVARRTLEALLAWEQLTLMLQRAPPRQASLLHRKMAWRCRSSRRTSALNPPGRSQPRTRPDRAGAGSRCRSRTDRFGQRSQRLLRNSATSAQPCRSAASQQCKPARVAQTTHRCKSGTRAPRN